MSCDCYKIGGPWITYDPNCPKHGDYAQREQQEMEEQQAEAQKTMDDIISTVDQIQLKLKEIERKLDLIIGMR